MPTLADVGALLVAPGEALWGRHLVDHRMGLREGMRAGIAALGLAAADMAAGGTEPEVEPAAALLAASGLRLRKRLRNVFA